MTTPPDAAAARPGPGRAWPPAPVRFGALFATTAAVLLLAVIAPGPAPLDHVLLAVGVLVPVRLVQTSFRLGVQRLNIDGAYEAGLLVVLAEVREPWLLLVAAGAVLVSEARARRAPIKALTNLGVVVVPLAAGLGLLHLLAPADGPRGWPLLVAAVLLVLLLNELLLDGVVAAVTGTRTLDLLRRDAHATLAAGCVNVLLGLVVLGVLQTDHAELLVALPAVAVVLLAQQRRDLRDDTVSEVLPRMATAAQRLDAGDDEDLVAEVLRRTADVFGLRSVELVLLGWPGGGDRTTTLLPDGTVRTRPGRAAGGQHVLCRQLVTGNAPPVALGELRLHFPTTQQLTASDEQVLTTLVLTCASALARARSHREQAIAARRDHLTGLGNRLALQEELDARLPAVLDAHLQDPAAPGTALLLVDLDHFKEVNDTLGHSAGDRLLVELSARLVRALRPDDVVVRLGGDEFALLLVDVSGPEHALELAEAVRSRLAAPVLVGGLELPVEASIGVALAPRDGTCGDDLLRRADVAMYRAKDERNAVVVYDPGMDSGRDQQLSLLGQLHTAIREDQIVVHFQPVVSLADGSVVAAEALVRWEHPEKGLLAPGAFVPAAERTELVVPLTLAVLEHAVAEAVTWRNDRGEPVNLAVNLSPRCLLDRSLPAQVSRVLARHGLPGRLLVLEITETLALSELEVVEEVLDSLGELGVRLSLDDFGTGFSSMSALRRLPVAEVKLDRGFVADALTSRGARAVVDATVTLAHGLGLPVVGEGVETEEQLALLREAGCDLVQGYLLGRPVPAAQFRARLQEPARR